MLQKYLGTLLLFILFYKGNGQELFTGKVVDNFTKEPVKYAFIELNDTIVSTNDNGIFQCYANKGDAMSITHNSYEIELKTISENEDLIIYLDPYYYDLGSLRLNYPIESNIKQNNSIINYLENLGFIAHFKDGFNRYYEELHKSLNADTIIENSFSLVVKFTVSEEGNVNLNSLSNNSIKGIDKIKQALESQRWTSGEQKNNPSLQYFKFLISDSEETFRIIETPAEPNGGFQGFYQYISKKLKYPKDAKSKGIEGKVYVEFVVDETGSLTEIKVKEGIGYGCDEEAVRLIENSPKWSPPMQDDKPVKQRIVLPIYFKK